MSNLCVKKLSCLDWIYSISDYTVYFVGCVTNQQGRITDVYFHRSNLCDLIDVKLGKFGHLVVEEVSAKINIFNWEAARSQ